MTIAAETIAIDFHNPNVQPFQVGQKIKRVGLPDNVAKVHIVEGMKFVTGLGWQVKIPMYKHKVCADKYELVE